MSHLNNLDILSKPLISKSNCMRKARSSNRRNECEVKGREGDMVPLVAKCSRRCVLKLGLLYTYCITFLITSLLSNVIKLLLFQTISCNNGPKYLSFCSFVFAALYLRIFIFRWRMIGPVLSSVGLR